MIKYDKYNVDFIGNGIDLNVYSINYIDHEQREIIRLIYDR